jgi:hypothetical protein
VPNFISVTVNHLTPARYKLVGGFVGGKPLSSNISAYQVTAASRFGHRNRGLTIAERRIPMPTNTAALQIDSLKSQTAPSAIKTGIVVLCMIGLVAGLVLLSSITGAPDVSNIGQLVGP